MERKLSIGNADGLRESKNPNFKEMFFNENRHYRDLESSDCFLVLGRKGAGKTVLLKYFEVINHKPEDMVIVDYFEFGEIKTDELIEFSFNDVDLEVRSHFQKYYLLKSAFLAIANNYEDINFLTFVRKFGFFPAIMKYQRYKKIVANITSLNFIPKMEEVIREEVEYTTSNRDAIDAKFSVGHNKVLEYSHGLNMENQYSSKKVPTKYFANFEYYKSILEEISEFITVILLFDDLEEAPINIKSSEISYIADFIENIYRFNMDLNNYNGNSRAIVAVREDLMRRMILTNSNLSKKTADSSVNLNWVKENKLELEALIIHKLKHSDPRFIDYSYEEIVKKFFRANLDKDGNVVKVPPLSKMIQKTMSRPRDVVVYLNLILADKEIMEGKQISVETVMKYSTAASVALERELISEISSHFTSNANLTKAIGVLREVKDRTIKGGNLIEKYISSGFEVETAKVIAELLLQFSVIGKVTYKELKKPSRKHKYKQERIYHFQHYSAIQMVFEEQSEYILHEGLYKSLESY